MAYQIVLLLTIQVAMPCLFVAWLWVPACTGRLDWLVRALSGASYLAFLTVTVPWHWLSHDARYAVPALYGVAVALSWLRHRRLPWRPAGDASLLRRHGGNAALCLLFLAMTARSLFGHVLREEPVALAFPLGGGRYVVAQGGDSPAINHHNGNRSQRFALDIVALNPGGARAEGLLPEDLTRYAIFGRPVLSPCAGTVAVANDGLPDDAPPETRAENPPGNSVTIDCGNAYVLLAHFARGTVEVSEGHEVTPGQPLGKVGNSGNSTEPHLHIHAFRGASANYREGDAVPMTFEGRFLTRNAVVEASGPD